MTPSLTMRPQNIVTNAMTLASKFCYPNMFNTPWLTKGKIIDYARKKGWPHKKIEELIQEELSRHDRLPKGFRGTYEPVARWWESVHKIPPRDVYILLPLGSIPAGQNDKFDDPRIKYFKDPMDATKKSTAETKYLLEELKIADESYIIFLDDLLMPVPVMSDIYNPKPPEKTVEANLKALPEIIRGNFFSHICISGLIRDVGGSIAAMKNFIDSAKSEGIPIEEKARYNALLQDEQKFRKDLSTSKHLVEAFVDLQLANFAAHQLAGKYVYLVGSEQDVGCYKTGLELGGVSFERINPYEDVAETNRRLQIVKQGTVTSDLCMKRLRVRIEKTYLRENVRTG